MNIVKNGSFESLNWHNVPVGSTVNQQPEYWELSCIEIGSQLRSTGYFPTDESPVFERAETIPECVHKLAYQLPSNQQLGAPQALILEGGATYKAFSSTRPYGVELRQLIADPGKGTLSVDVPVQVHQQGDGSPGAAAWRVLVNGYTSPWFTFRTNFADRTWYHHTVTLEHGGGPIDFKLQLESRALGGIDFFVDNVVVDFTPAAPQVDYVVVVNLLPQNTSQAELATVLAKTYAQKQTLVYSADDAARLVAPGLPGSYVMVWNPESWTDDIVAWLTDRGVADVRTTQFDGPPVPPASNEPAPYKLRSDNLIGLHSGFARAQTWNYVTHALPTVQKFFSAGDCYESKKRAPECVTVWRKFVDELPSMPTTEQARWYVDQYAQELATASTALGITVDQLLQSIDFVESYNEMVPTHNQAAIEYAVDFDVAFADELYRRYGHKAHPLLLNVAVGNPHETEVELLIPAVEAAVKYGGAIGYHSYWGAKRGRSFLEDGWPYYAGRWMEWDKVFVAHGLYPRYLSTESGICLAEDGVSMNPVEGWKACGSFEYYLTDINKYNRHCLDWNRDHANRFIGMVIFCYGGWGWGSFELGDGEVVLLNGWATGAAIVKSVALEIPVDPKAAYLRDLEEYLVDAPYLTEDAHERMMRALFNGGEFEAPK